MIEEDIEFTRKEWNEHTIRKQNCRNVVGGKPNELFHSPEDFDGNDCSKPVNLALFEEFPTQYTQEPVIYHPEFVDFLEENLPEDIISVPTSLEGAFDLYVKIIDTMAQIPE